MFEVCKFRIDSQKLTVGSVDYDSPHASSWLGKFWRTLSGLCIHFKHKK